MLGIAPQTAEGVRGHTLAALTWSVSRLVLLYEGVHRDARIRDRSSYATRNMLNMLFTARQLDRLRELPPDHRVLTGRDGSPMVERADGRLWRVQPNGSLAPAAPVEMLRSTFAPTSTGHDDG